MNHLSRSLFLIILTLAGVRQLDAQWIESTSPYGGSIYAVTEMSTDVSGTLLFAATDGGVFLSTDVGTTWTSCNSGLTDLHIRSLAVSGAFLLAGTTGGQVFRSSNGGSTWDTTGRLNGSGDVVGFVMSGTSLFVGKYGGGIFRSTDDGSHWTAVDAGLSDVYITALATIGLRVFAGGSGGVFLSVDYGANWSRISDGLPDSVVRCLATCGTDLFDATSMHGVFRSTDFGDSWTSVQSGLPNSFGNFLTSFAVKGTAIFAGTNGGGVFLSSDSGTSWVDVTAGLFPYLLSLAATESDLYAGIFLGGLWRRPLSELMTSINSATNVQPDGVHLFQNYPNPFNPATVIGYSVLGDRGQGSGNSSVKLVVYDILGRQVAVLVDERKAPGRYEVSFDGSRLTSGVYFYRLRAGRYMATKAMILQR